MNNQSMRSMSSMRSGFIFRSRGPSPNPLSRVCGAGLAAAAHVCALLPSIMACTCRFFQMLLVSRHKARGWCFRAEFWVRITTCARVCHSHGRSHASQSEHAEQVKTIQNGLLHSNS
jgi:hypothetical protein